MSKYFGEIVRELTQSTLEDYANKNEMSVTFYSTNRQLALVNSNGKNVIDVDFDYQNIRSPLTSDV